jgi:NDP-sugar pyrophosphorylase family protein
MRAVILAGGKGTRLRPYTTTLPKPLVPVGEEPILAIVIRQLAAAGVDRITLAVNHMAELIMAFFGTGEKYGVSIDYSIESTPLGTVGPLRLIHDLPENFIVMNGDVLTDLPYDAIFRAHRASQADLTIAAYRREYAVDFGVLGIDERTNRVVAFREKPVHAVDVSMGVYVFNRRLLAAIPADRPYGLDNLLLDMLDHDQTINTYRYEGYWLDLGRPDDYDRANNDVRDLLSRAHAPKNGSRAEKGMPVVPAERTRVSTSVLPLVS